MEQTFKDTIVEIYSWYKGLDTQNDVFKMKFEYPEIPDFEISLMFNRKD